ncbi:MAG: nuclear transport factor 2 family protein [Chthoniobacterales bacterium]
MTTTPAHPQAESWARALYGDSVDQKDAVGFAAAFAEDGTLRFGNQPAIVGRPKIEEAITQFFLAMVSLRHEFIAISCDGDTLFLEALVTYHRHDDKIVSVPAMTVFEMDDNFLARNCRIYVDLTPLFAES